ncbi:MAG: iron-sulfur cluster assembly protein [Desulfomonilaceae bacterium]|nr:iron-sulfur cluster assembly protein [Desulfomonilaceae bacterium]
MKNRAKLEQVEDALARVMDPETGLSIMRMAIVDNLEVEDTGEVSLVFRPSSPVCPMAYTLANSMKKTVEALDWVTSVRIKVENFQRAEHLETVLNR